MKSWYEELFSNYAKTYDKEPFTQGTIGEVDFIEQELQNDTSKTILDVGCGTGRHAIELARRGYTVTGIDLSESQLQRAREKAKAASVNVSFLNKDARDFLLKEPFDAVIMICEGAFSLMETDEMNFRILQSAERALKQDGIFIFTCLCALFPLFHSVKDFLNQAETKASTNELSFDLMSFRETSQVTVTDDAGQEKTLTANERYYTPTEIRWLLQSLNFKTIDIYGSHLGEFSRDHALTTEDFEMLVIGRK
jgi:2-polyprenyl-3-methyl-5-hydroxy-6-metoxy-1,4-benzoquinol methylase